MNSCGLKASIIIPVLNDWSYTRSALESIKRYTGEPYEIIVVDNGSNVPILNHIKGFCKRNPELRVTYVRADKNLGFSGGCNRGIEVSRGDLLVILNNDVLVTPGWLESLKKSFRDTRIGVGIAGPLSNFVAGAQLVEDCPLRFESPDRIDFGALSSYALKLRERNWGRYISVPFLIGLCMAIKREVVEEIGGFDERFYPGNFEDNDLCLRARLKGYEALICCEAFVYHFGSKTFKSLDCSYEETLRENMLRFTEKWGVSPMEPHSGLTVSQRALDTELTDERLVFPLFEGGIFVLEWEEKKWMKKLEFLLSHPYRENLEVVIPVNGFSVSQIAEKIENFATEKGINLNSEITLFSGKCDDLYSGFDGRIYKILSMDDPDTCEAVNREDIFRVYVG